MRDSDAPVARDGMWERREGIWDGGEGMDAMKVSDGGDYKNRG